MSINRHNYESFFLMYTDHELSASEKLAVEQFVQANPDLAEELSLLQQSTLQPETMSFDKNSLIKETISEDVHERLLMHLHKELAATDSNAMQFLIEDNTAVSREFCILQQTVLPAETIIFEDKASLYRKEPSRVIAMRWTKWVAAAMLIGLGGWFGMKSLVKTTDTTDSTSMAKNSPSAKDSGSTIMSTDKKGQAETADVNQQLIAAQNDLSTTKQKDIAPSKVNQINKDQNRGGQITEQKNRGIASIKTSKDNQTVAVASKKSTTTIDNTRPEPYSQNVNNNGSNKTTLASVEPKKVDIEPSPVTSPDLTNDAIKKLVRPNEYASLASSNDDNGNGETLSSFDEDSKIKKTKLGGFLRKVKRVVLRNTQVTGSGDNKIKVANLEFAIQ